MNKFSVIFGSICFILTIVFAVFVTSDDSLVFDNESAVKPVDDKILLETKIKAFVEDDCVIDTSKLSIASKEAIKTSCTMNLVKDETMQRNSQNHYVLKVKEDGSKTEQTVIFSKTRIK